MRIFYKLTNDMCVTGLLNSAISKLTSDEIGDCMKLVGVDDKALVALAWSIIYTAVAKVLEEEFPGEDFTIENDGVMVWAEHPDYEIREKANEVISEKLLRR